MEWVVLFVLFIVLYFLYNFFKAFNKDKHDLEFKTLDQKFFGIVSLLNKAAFNNEGEVTRINMREFSLFKEESNQIIYFQYSTGHLTIEWKFIYLHKEVSLHKKFDYVRNISIIEQGIIGEKLINEMSELIHVHKKNVWDEIA